MNSTDLFIWNDFQVQWNGKRHLAEYGENFPQAGREYLDKYLAKSSKYKNITPQFPFATYSLYQPPLATPAGKRSLFYRLLRRFENMRLPAAATIGVTKKCQCHCQHCSASYHMNTREAALSDTLVMQALAETVALGAVNIILVGGEPLLKKSLPDIIHSVAKDKAMVTMFTNGEYLTRENCRKLKDAGLFGLFVSVDGAEGKSHDAHRQREGLFAGLVQGIKNAQENDLVIALSSFLTGDNLSQGHLSAMMGLGRELQVSEVTFFDAIAVGRMAQPKSGSFLSLDDHRKILELTDDYRKKSQYPAISPQSVLTSPLGSSFCYAANTQFYLSATGQMTPCDFTPLSIGRYPEKSIEELWSLMTTSALYKKRSKHCRMQDPAFRRITLDRIPQGAKLPYPIQNLIN
jgi:MoaA/NifB/PqqE/SkfB family radical SAM enzyme